MLDRIFNSFTENIFPFLNLFTFFRSNSYMHLNRLLNILESARLIKYRLYSSQNRWFVSNPDFFGTIYPQIPDLSGDVDVQLEYPEREHNIQWQYLDLKVMQYHSATVSSPVD